MKRRHFLLGMTSWPLLLGLSQKSRAEPSGPSSPNPDSAAPAAGDAVTTDVFEGTFPPVSYGRTLEEAETTIQEVVERIFRDQDGILRSGVNGRTMRPLRVDEVKDRPLGLGTYVENSSFPRAYKPVWLNYENAGQASGTYLEALCAKATATGDARVRQLARRTVEAIATLWENAATTSKQPLGGTGRGWFPKPYDGIRNVSEMYECSVDQYSDVTHGLHTYYLTLADEAEKRKIEQIVTSFAEWWYDHDYCGVYLGKGIWWKRLEWHSMAVGYFLYLNALAQSWKPSPKFQHGFEIWSELKVSLQAPGKPLIDVNMHGLTLNSLERLVALRPDLADYWRTAIARQVSLLEEAMSGKATVWKDVGSFDAVVADYLITAHQFMPERGFRERARRHLEASMDRASFYHIKRGRRLADLGDRRAGDDYRNTFWCENHVHWMTAYWKGGFAQHSVA